MFGTQTRRGFLSGGLAALAAGGLAPLEARKPADLVLRISPVQHEVAPGFIYGTTAYNGSAPASLVRLRQGVPTTVDIFNETGQEEYVHWHGLEVSADLDGTQEEKSLSVPAHGHLRYTFTPQQPGTRWVHSHAMSHPKLDRGVYSGQFAMVYVEPKENPGAYDREIFLVTHEWGPELVWQSETAEEAEEEAGPVPVQAGPSGNWEVEYDIGSVNGRALGHGAPLPVREGERVLFHILNASATATQQLSLAGHAFRVVALDGNPVARPQTIEVLELGAGERISAMVDMSHPGVWVLGAVRDNDREVGRMGTVVEYAGKSGAPKWVAPPRRPWDYSVFAEPAKQVELPAEQVLPMVIDRIPAPADGMERWTINGDLYDGKPTPLQQGLRYRLVFQNRTEDDHPVHLHRSSFELTRLHGRECAGIWKDVVMLKRYGRLEVDFTPSQKGLLLFHCHQQMHMDNGFKKLFEVI